MNKENQIDKQNLIFSQNPNYNDNPQFLKKEIIYNIDKEKYYLYDKENNKIIPTNSFGKKMPRINNAQVGQASYDERLKSKSVEKIINKIDDSLYHPRMKNFDGFSQIPRPLVQPFSNDKTLSNKNNILNFFQNKKTFISIKKSQILFNRDNENIPDLDYYTGTISGNIINNNINSIKNKNKVLKSIDDTLNNGNLNKKEIESLKNLKNKLLNNSRNIINGKELNQPNEIFQKIYNINHNVIFINPTKNLSKNKDKLINLNTYHILYKSINNNPLTALKINNTIDNQIYYKKINNLNKGNIKVKIKLGRPKSVINIKSASKLLNNRNHKNINSVNIDINKKIPKIPRILLPKKYEISKNESQRYDTEDDYKDIFNENKNKIGSHSTNNIHLNKKIHYFIDFKKCHKNEKKFLMGYQKPYRKEIPLLRKGIPKYKSMAELYKKDLEMFKIVNPDKIKLEEEENKRRMNFLKKKIEKDRIIQIVKYRNLKGKKSRLNSAVSNIGKVYNDI